MPLLPTLRTAVRAYRDRETLDVSGGPADAEHALTRYLLYCQMPLWTAAGVLDWYWHKTTDLEHTSGTKESLIHLLMFAEVGAPIVAGLVCEINAGVLAAMAGALAAHELTAFWDVVYAVDRREVGPAEQHTHSFLEMLPFMGLVMTACLHWEQARSLVARGGERPDFRLRLKRRRLPDGYLAAVAAMMLGGVVVPYANELWRCVRAAGEPPADA